MTNLTTLQRGRQSFERREWSESDRLLRAADEESPLDAEDLERLATAAWLLGRDGDCEAFTTRAHQAFLDREDREGAARAAFWLGFGLMERGAMAPASGWFARAGRVLDEARVDSVVRGYLLIPAAITALMQGDAAAAHATFGRAAEIAGRFADRDLASIACHARGRALIRLGRVAQGGRLLDEAMASVVAGDVSARVAGDVYCSVLGGCHEIFDLRRAYEWTASLAQWCEAQPGLVRYRGECLYYRAEMLQLRGKWSEAARDADSACELLLSRPAAGAAFYRRGEIHRLRGELASAEEAYTAAHERGRKPQPGLSLLRLAEGRADDAAASIRSALLDTQTQIGRARMLPAAVEILLAAGDAAAAHAAATELSAIAADFDAPLLTAAAAHAAGAVLLAQGDVEAASASLRQAREMWRELQTPYEEAQTCLLLAAVCEKRSDGDGRRLETETARRILTQLEADFRLDRVPAQPPRSPHQRAGPLSEREAQVLRLVAAGKTNRAIADALFISQKTVARHVSNIFDKLGVSNRSAATAWAFKHNLT